MFYLYPHHLFFSWLQSLKRYEIYQQMSYNTMNSAENKLNKQHDNSIKCNEKWMRIKMFNKYSIYLLIVLVKIMELISMNFSKKCMHTNWLIERVTPRGYFLLKLFLHFPKTKILQHLFQYISVTFRSFSVFQYFFRKFLPNQKIVW